ncbi:MAG: Gfo/Idh/MocA family oxidoreductase [Clostridia bacterium]|nr:Gfo/Idh/MocA family oxidoreductase [Clostridia bacterium]
MKKELRIGLLGFGAMGKTHTYSVSTLPFFYNGLPFSAEYVAVCTSRIETARAAVDQYRLGSATASEDDVIYDKDVDIVDISTPNIFHYETAKKAILAGKHVLCEKPLAVTAEQASELASLARDAFERNGQVCGMVFNNRHLAAVKRAKELIDEGRLGRIISFDFKYLHNSCIDPERTAGWKQDKNICGAGTLFDLGSHIVDLCRYLCGEFTEIYAKEQIAFPEHKKADGSIWQTNADEAVYMTATLACGAVGTLTAGKINVGENDGLTFAIYGTEGTLKFDLMELDWLYFYDSHAEGGNFGGMHGFTKIECVGRYSKPGGGFPSPKAPNGWLRGHVGSMYAYLSAVCEGREVSPSFEDGAKAQIILEAAHRSHLEGKAIKIL